MSDRHNRSRRGFLRTTGAAGLAVAAGCMGDDGNDGGDVQGDGDDGETADKIVFYNAGSLEYDQGTEANIERFQDDTGIEVETNEVPWDNLKTSLTTIWRNEDSKVDAFNGPTWWLADFVSSGWIDPLDLDDEHMDKFPDSLTGLVTFDGEVYMAPEFGKWGTYLYDEETVESPPDTWDEVLEMDAGDQNAFGFTWGNKDVFTFKQFIYQAGGQLFNEDNEPTFAGEEGLETMEFLIELNEKDLIPNGTSSMEEGDVGDAFVAGEFATVESWTPLGSRALEADGWGEERLGSAKPPEGPGGSRATFQDTNGIAISAYSERKAAAKKFAEYMTTRESCKNNMLVEGNPCVVPDVYEDEEVQDEYPDWLLEDMKYNLENAKSETYLAQPQVDDYISQEITPALLGEKDPEQALQDAQENVQRLYEDIGIL